MIPRAGSPVVARDTFGQGAGEKYRFLRSFAGGRRWSSRENEEKKKSQLNYLQARIDRIFKADPHHPRSRNGPARGRNDRYAMGAVNTLIRDIQPAERDATARP